MENTENTETAESSTYAEIIGWKTDEGRWVVGGLIAAVGEMSEEDKQAFLTVLSEEISFLRSPFHG